MLKLPQFIKLLNYFNIEYPQNLAKFLTSFDTNIFSLINSAIINFVSSLFGKAGEVISQDEMRRIEGEIGCRVHAKLDENDLGCFVITNSGGTIFFLLVLLIVKLTILGFAMFFRSKDKSKIEILLGKLNKKLGLKFFATYIIALELELIIPLAVNLRHMSFKGVLGVSSCLFTLIGVIFYFLFVCLINFKITKQSLPNKKNTDDNGGKNDTHKWIFLVENLKEDYKAKKEFNIGKQVRGFEILCDFIHPLVLILCIRYPGFQLFPLLTLYTILALVSIIYRPFDSSMENIKTVAIRSVSCLILAFVALLWIFREKWTKETKENWVGLPVIWLIIVLVTAIGLIGIYETFIGINRLVKMLRKKKNAIIITPEKAKLDSGRLPEKSEEIAINNVKKDPNIFKKSETRKKDNDDSSLSILNRNEDPNEEEQEKIGKKNFNFFLFLLTNFR